MTGGVFDEEMFQSRYSIRGQTKGHILHFKTEYVSIVCHKCCRPGYHPIIILIEPMECPHIIAPPGIHVSEIMRLRKDSSVAAAIEVKQ